MALAVGNTPPLKRWGTLLAVAAAATFVNALALSASQLWVSPDASYYVALAGGIADQLDFSNELFLIRPPGYPLMLAGVFRLFGSWSPIAILVVQHAMVVGTALVTALTAWHLTYRRSVSLVAGLMCAGSLQLLAFANVIMTEVPYTIALGLSVLFLVKYHRGGGARLLAFASLMAGVSYLLRPTGILVVPVCMVAALHRAWKERDACSCSRPSLQGRSKSVFEKPEQANQGVPEGATGGLPARVVLASSKAPAASCQRHPTSRTRSKTDRRVGTTMSVLPVFGATGLWRRLVVVVPLAVAPAAAFVLPVMWHNRSVHGADPSGLTAGVSLYSRLLSMDGLDSTKSEALADIRAVVAEAIRRGDVSPHHDHTQWGPVWWAYEAVRGLPFAGSSVIMARAARDIIDENRTAFLDHTARYAFWMVMVPDAFYRFHPGGAPGWMAETGEWCRDQNAAILDIGTYLPMLDRWIDPYERYLPLTTEPRATTPLWSGIARWFHDHIEKGPPLTGLGDSPYEEFRWLCFVGMAVSLVRRDRFTWMLVAGVIFLQVLVSATLAGPTPRYAVPLGPLMICFLASLIVLAADQAWVLWVACLHRRSRGRHRSRTLTRSV